MILAYGIPENAVVVTLSFYQGISCSVWVDGQLADWFKIITVVRQECLLSLLLFQIIMDWIVDFVDDIALLNETWIAMQQLTNKIEAVACNSRVYMNIRKTKFMKIRNFEEFGINQIGEGSIENVKEFF